MLSKGEVDGVLAVATTPIQPKFILRWPHGHPLDQSPAPYAAGALQTMLLNMFVSGDFDSLDGSNAHASRWYDPHKKSLEAVASWDVHLNECRIHPSDCLLAIDVSVDRRDGFPWGQRGAEAWSRWQQTENGRVVVRHRLIEGNRPLRQELFVQMPCGELGGLFFRNRFSSSAATPMILDFIRLPAKMFQTQAAAA